MTSHDGPATAPPVRNDQIFRSHDGHKNSAHVEDHGDSDLARFVEDGGLLITLGVSSFFPPEFGLTRIVDAQRPQANFYAPGPIVQAEILQPSHPLFFGYAHRTIPVRWADGPLLRVPDVNDTPTQSGALPRPAVLMRFAGAQPMSGLMRGSDQIRRRPALVDATV